LKTGGAPGGNLDFGHDHDDDMNVWVFADGEWLTSLVPGYWIGRVNGWPEANRTKYANALLIDGQGQLGEGPRSDAFSAPSNAWFFDRTSSIPLRGSTAHFAYALGAGSKLYDAALGLDTWGRSILFVDRTLVLVRDVVHASAAHRFDVIWHAIDDVEQDGTWLKLHAKNDRLLGVDVVAPAGFALSTEAQSGLQHEDEFDADDSMTAAMVHPSSDVAAVTFLEALVPSRGATWASKPNVSAIDGTTPDRGVTIALGASTVDVVFAGAPTETQTAKNVSPTGMAGVRETSGGKTTRAMLAAGSALTLDGTKWIEVLDGVPASVEVVPTATGVDVSGDGKKLRIYAPGATTVTWNGATVEFDRDGDFVVIPKLGGTLGDAGPDGGGPIDGGGPGQDAGTNGATPGDEGSSGCGCRVAGPPAPPGYAAASALVVVLAAFRRRRRAVAAARVDDRSRCVLSSRKS
jgi:MYXO-CTERM domain-containing protein